MAWMLLINSRPPDWGAHFDFARSLLKEFDMRTLLSIAVLMSAATSAFAAPVGQVPEPEVLGLLAIGAIGMLVALRRKK
jgi:hypothetical protein